MLLQDRDMMNNKPLFAISLLSAFGLAACDDHTQGKPTATVSEAVKTPTAKAAQEAKPAETAPVETIAITPDNSKVEFTGAKVTGSHDGGFKEFSGTAKVAARDLTQSSVELTIQTASVFTDTEKLTGHLKSPDFFDVEKIPTATFKSTRIAKKQDGTYTHVVTGDLTLHGITKSISFPAKISLEENKFSAHSEFVINRKDFNIKYPGMPDDLIKDEVVIKLSLALPRSKVEG